MKYLFKQAVKIGPRFYSLGYHAVPPEHEEDAFFQRLIQHGLVLKPEDAALSAPKLKIDIDSLPPQAKSIAEKIIKKQEYKGDEATPNDEKGGSEEIKYSDPKQKPAKPRK